MELACTTARADQPVPALKSELAFEDNARGQAVLLSGSDASIYPINFGAFGVDLFSGENAAVRCRVNEQFGEHDLCPSRYVVSALKLRHNLGLIIVYPFYEFSGSHSTHHSP